MASQIRVGPLFAVGGGVILIWSAITGRKMSTVLRDLISGKDPRKAPTTANPITGYVSTPPVGSSGFPGIGSGPLPGVGAGGSYSSSALEHLWIMAGGDPSQARNAACHGMQESGGRASATSANPDGGTNVGIWQLDTPGGKGAGYSIQQLMNPLLNARITVRATNNGRDWSAWATPGC